MQEYKTCEYIVKIYDKNVINNKKFFKKSTLQN